MHIRTFSGLVTVCLMLAMASSTLADRKEELKAAFAARRPALDAAKVEGKIGETFRGFIEAVQKDALKDAALKVLVEQENADRSEAYHRIAAKTQTTVDDVAARGAAKHFDRARPGDYLKHADGQWRKKA